MLEYKEKRGDPEFMAGPVCHNATPSNLIKTLPADAIVLLPSE